MTLKLGNEVCHCILYTIEYCIIQMQFTITKIWIVNYYTILFKTMYIVHMCFTALYFRCAKQFMVEILGLVVLVILRL